MLKFRFRKQTSFTNGSLRIPERCAAISGINRDRFASLATTIPKSEWVMAQIRSEMSSNERSDPRCPLAQRAAARAALDHPDVWISHFGVQGRTSSARLPLGNDCPAQGFRFLCWNSGEGLRSRVEVSKKMADTHRALNNSNIPGSAGAFASSEIVSLVPLRLTEWTMSGRFTTASPSLTTRPSSYSRCPWRR